MEDSGRERQIDKLYLDEFRLKSKHNPNIQFLEEAVNSWEQTLNLIRELEGEYDLYVVGRRHGSTSPAKAFSDHYLSQTDDQLGPLGEALLTSSFAINASILVVQQGAVVDEPEDENVSVI
ncbi:cation/H(+) antiporter 15 [Prunus yedoensis var. nudiflora]|uniref:Cation/H(+) antiporter 15 n=1 Tax=Prunus yedoensis var. nudiflora TaxID=2094558 RepID=A0A314YCZ6_PRUYE|nr:cation/H(+) antiporter 15 [Prunus yedoensis var. nudiflora]